MTTPEKNKREVQEKKLLILPHTPLQVSSLPHELVVSCLALVSRSYYPTLSLASKSFQVLVTSPELYQTRSLLNLTETYLYVCLQPCCDDMPQWFTLCPKSTLTNESRRKEENSSGYVLATASISPKRCSCFVMIGSNIYSIGGSFYQHLSSVSILDCCSHKWHTAPRMLVKRGCPTANVVDGKIYVTGGSKELNSSNWMEVFDPKTQTWELVPCPFAGICKNHNYKSAVIEGKIYYMFGHEFVVYKQQEDKWEIIRERAHLDRGWSFLSDCVINNILYCYSSILDGIQWYDFKIGRWRRLTGLKGLPMFVRNSHVKLADYGGKLAVFWDKYVPSTSHIYADQVIWCAVITLERHNNLEMWGIVQWLGDVLTFPESYEYVYALSSTV